MPTSYDPRPAMVEIAQLMYARRLTNSAGGNISCRVEDYVFITPRYLGSKQRWQLRPEQVLVFDRDYQIIEGEPAKISREGRMHFACYQNFPQINGVIHAHPQYLTVFATAGVTLPPVKRYRRPYEGTDNLREAMQGYLDWEFGLVAQLARDGTHHFRVN